MAKRKKSEIKQEKTEKVENIENVATETTKEEKPFETTETADNMENIDPLLSAPIVEREYSGKNAFDIHGETPISVEEPQNGKIIVDADGSGYEENEEIQTSDDEEQEYGETQKQKQERQQQYTEPQADDDGLDPKTKRQMASNIADTIVDGYKMLLEGGKNIAKRPKEWYQMKAIQGKFDMRVFDFKVDVGGGEMVRYGNFVNNYNEIVDGVIELDKEKEKRMRILSKRVCEKHGVGMSDELTLGLLVGGDLLQKVGLLFQQHKMLNNVENYVTKMYQQQLNMQRAESDRMNVVRNEYKKPTETTKEEKPTEKESTTTNVMETKEKGE